MVNDPDTEHPDFEGETIDLISLDEKTGNAVLHLSVSGTWEGAEIRLQWIRRRLNMYLFFVRSGQLSAIPKFAGHAPKFVVHCEFFPPPLAIQTFGRMARHLSDEGVGLGITVGTNFISELPLSSWVK